MNAKDIIKDTEAKMRKTVEATQREFSVVRTGRASTSLVDSLRVDYYGAPTPLRQIASITTPDARLVMVQPWDKNAKKYDTLRYIDVLKKGLKVMDATATSLCMDNELPIIVFNLKRAGNIKRVIMGERIGTTVKGRGRAG